MRYLPRTAADALSRLGRGFPVLVITGPRQSGKTTLARRIFGDKPYVSLEDPEEREFANTDPRRFLSRFGSGAVLDEAQRCPDLLSYLQGEVDGRGRMGEFVLTGSQQFGLMSGITQSLAGRAALMQLLPFSMTELHDAGKLPGNLDDLMIRGGYPPLYDREISPEDWFPNYVNTYLERDVRQLLNVRDLGQFQRFVRLCAARTGQLLNLSALGADAGVTHVTVREWLTVLEASYLIALVRPYHRNFGKRLIKAPKLYFLDVGLAAWLLGIRRAESLAVHAQRGALFETLVFSEILKWQLHAGHAADLYIWRDSIGNEVDLLLETPEGLQAIEIKSGATFATDWPTSLRKWSRLAGQEALRPWLIYGGERQQELEDFELVGWRGLPDRLASRLV